VAVNGQSGEVVNREGTVPSERSFDDLTRGLASDNVSRRGVLKLVGSSLLGGVLASIIPGVASIWSAAPAAAQVAQADAGDTQAVAAGSDGCVAARQPIISCGECICTTSGGPVSGASHQSGLPEGVSVACTRECTTTVTVCGSSRASSGRDTPDCTDVTSSPFTLPCKQEVDEAIEGATFVISPSR